ncbi:succinate dehydrogenase [Peptococcaceae bacterium]|nr:succinate dehydrogenase [Peptococcaceae bacterium]
MQLQHTLTKSSKTEFYYELLELITGLFLVIFLKLHMLFVGTIILGADVFNALAQGMDAYYLGYIFKTLTILAFFTHFIVAGRRIPTRIKEQKIIWRHAKLLRHPNTWLWVFQVITGMAILVLGAIHMWVVLTNPPTEALSSAMRVQAGYLWFYIVLLLLGQYHAGVGLYRQFVKWGWLPRKPVGYIIIIINLIIIVIGSVALGAFMQLGGS